MTNYIEFSAKIKEKYPQYKDVDDLTLAQKMVEKYPEYKEKVTFEEVTQPKDSEKGGIDLTPSGLYKKAVAYPAAGLRAAVRGEDFNTALDNTNRIYNDFKPAKGAGDFLFDMGIYSKIPTLRAAGGAGKVQTAGTFLGNAALQGGVPGALETLKRGGNAAEGAGAGTGIAAVLQGLPYAGKLLSKPANYISKKAIESVTSLKPATIEQLVKPNSQALDLTEGSAQQLLANTTERVRDAYNNLLGKRGEAVRDAASKLNDNASRVNADELINDIVSTFDQYGGDLVNPARNMAGGLEKELIDLVNSGKPVTKINTSILPEFTGDKTAYNQAIKELYKQNVRGKIINHPESGDINFYKSGAGKTIYENPQDFEQLSLLPQIDEIVKKSKFQFNEPLNKIRKDDIQNFDILKGKANIDGDIVDTNIHIANTKDGKKFYFNKKPDAEISELHPYGNQFPTSGTNIITDNEEFFNSLSPNDLQKVKEQIGKMAKWGDEISRNYAEPITRQIYNKFNQRLSDLSPELAQANAEYAALRNFQNNEGLKRILKPGDNIDSASSVLRNYNSTITKGNAGRNIQELEDVLVKNGEQPFLNVIDDINAANDLLKNIETGRNWLGATTLAKGLVTPALKGIREINRAGIPAKIQNIKEAIAPIAKLLPALGAKGAANMLYGGVEYNDYR